MRQIYSTTVLVDEYQAASQFRIRVQEHDIMVRQLIMRKSLLEPTFQEFHVRILDSENVAVHGPLRQKELQFSGSPSKL